MHLEGTHGAAAVDVSLDEVAAEPCVGRKRALEVHSCARRKVAEIRARETFREQIEAQRVVGAIHDGQAAAIDRDAVTDARIAASQRCVQCEPRSGRGAFERKEFACFFDEAGEHRRRI
jgi:hypothetical protein